MAFFANDAINRVNLHYAIQSLASNAAGVFFFRRHERELEQRAEAALPGPWLQQR